MAEKKTNKVKYTEPAGYFPKEVMKQLKKDAAKNKAAKKSK